MDILSRDYYLSSGFKFGEMYNISARVVTLLNEGDWELFTIKMPDSCKYTAKNLTSRLMVHQTLINIDVTVDQV